MHSLFGLRPPTDFEFTSLPLSPVPYNAYPSILSPYPDTAPEPLFDSNQSALFSTFLNTFDENEDFLFNPSSLMGFTSPPSGDGGAWPAGMNTVAASMSAGYSRDDEERSYISQAQYAAGSSMQYDGDSTMHLADSSDNHAQYRDDKSNIILLDSSASTSAAKVPTRAPAVSKSRSKSRVKSTRKVTSTRRALSATPTSPDAAERQPASPSPSSSATATPQKSKSSAAGGKKQPLTALQKRANHILSEQTRRSAIKEAFKNLVDLLVAGSSTSGIFLEGDAEEPESEEEAAEEPEQKEEAVEGESSLGRRAKGKQVKAKPKPKAKAKGKGRGRGRKAECGNGVAKSIILDQAVDYIEWLERGNAGLLAELARA